MPKTDETPAAAPTPAEMPKLKPEPKPDPVPGERWQLRAVLKNGKTSVVLEDFDDTDDLDDAIARVWDAPVRVKTVDGFSFFPPSAIVRVDVARVDGD